MITFMTAVHAAYPNKIYGWDGTNKATLVISDVTDIDFDLIAQKKIELDSAEPFRQLRIQRNQLLAETDWRMVSDYQGTNQAEWQTYRQALRDITTQTPSLDENGNLTGIIWPTPPTD